ncbi:MAG TPA: hypothetical protein VHP33_33845 [Polyangiaceae bacterium]|nr:hypothetical protein [Polyangiaceae bacterium]
MSSAKSWFLIGLLGLSCVVPDVEVVEETDEDPGTSGKSSKASTGGRSSTAGTNQGGGGSDDGGTSSSAGTGTSPNQGGTSSTTGSAVGKFCNDITVDGENFPLTLTIGTATEQTVFTADSGTCRPISGKACAGIPVGTDLTVTLLADDVEIVSYPVEVADGDAWIFLAYADGENIDVAGDPVTDAVCRLGYDAPAAPPAQ